MKTGKRIFIWVIVLILAVGGLALSSPATAQVFNMRITTDTPDVMPQGVAATWFGQELQKRIPGSQVKVFNASSLMNNPDSMEAMYSGTLEACWATMSKIAGILPQVLAIRMPALFSTYEQARAIPKTEFGKYIEKAALSKKFVLLGWGNLSPYTGVGAKQRILAVADWKGKKVRCYDKITQVVEVRLAGGAPTVMAWGDFVPSVQSGVVDAGFTSLGSWGPVKETVPYFTCIGIVQDYYPFLVAKAWWDSLPPQTQATVKEVVEQACARQVEMQYQSDMKDLEKLGTKDPKKIGVYILEGQELEPYKKLWSAEVEKSIIQAIGSGGKEAVALAVAISKK
jgi:TRAP-type C4-dicarboxylate transport system substrate-binding protein